MHTEAVDIIVPVWNHPVETRACLVSLIENSSHIRLILVDNSCDSETERMLGEFAEALDVRALFLKNRSNEGFVKAVNRGLGRAESGYVAIVRQNSTVRPGWLDLMREFMDETPDAGIVVPGYVDRQTKKKMARNAPVSRGTELPHADFAGLLIRRSLLDSVGKFNEDMDGGFWCLMEYSRRGLKGGYRTCAVPESVVEKSSELNLGSLSRRAEREQMLALRFKKSWGEEEAYCIYLPRSSDLSCMNERLRSIAAAARQGNRIMLAVHPAVESELVRAGVNRAHEYISIASLSRFMTERSARKAFDSFSAHGLPITHVRWGDETLLPGVCTSIDFSEFESIVIEHERVYYGRTGLTAHSGGVYEE